ncbi:MAG: alpha/beta hydrolase [Candidatus Eiseniibacteriota bacterium]
MSQTYDVQRSPVTVRYNETAQFTETYGFVGSTGMVMVEGQLMVPRGQPSKTLLVFMHPSSTLNLLPLPNALPAAGVHVMCCGSRYAKNDSALIMEKVALDLGAYIRHAKETLGYEKVVLAGWSGGGSLSMFYQAEAERPTIKTTPAGDPVDLTQAKLIPADATMFLAAHLSRAKTLTEWIDPSVTNELDPDTRVRELDLYDDKNPNQPPYSADFLERYRAAQIARNRKITTWVRETMDRLKKANTGELERGFVVHRTMADPRWLDPAVDPNDRKPRWCYLGNPRTVNVGPVGLARFCTLRSWLSQWSYDESRADGPANAARISVPVMVIENSADDAAPSSHARAIFAATGSKDKEMQVVKGATHYYQNQPEHLAQAVVLVTDWLKRKNLIAG